MKKRQRLLLLGPDSEYQSLEQKNELLVKALKIALRHEKALKASPNLIAFLKDVLSIVEPKEVAGTLWKQFQK